MTTNDVRAIAQQAYAFGYAMVENYRTAYSQAVDSTDPRYVGGFGTYRHYPQPARPENTDIVTPNNDTPYSWGWFDLRAEPWVVTVPAIDRYYILPFHDVYTIYAGYVGAVRTGPAAGSYLLAGPSWDGALPDGIDGVISSTTQLLGCLGRTALMNDGVDALRAIQDGYVTQPLSSFLGAPAPAAAPDLAWPVWDEAAHTSTIAFFDLLDFLLALAPVLEEDAEVRAQLASIGLDGTGTFDAAALDAASSGALAAGLEDGRADLATAASSMTSSTGLFGTREEMAGKYVERNVGAMKGLYGLPAAEAWYGGWVLDSEGNHPVGSRGYTVTFGADELPRARFFWSATMYGLPDRLLVANPIDRFSIGDRTAGIVYADDGSLTVTISADEPTDPVSRANWLPAPTGGFSVIVRAYGGDASIVSGAYRLPPLRPLGA
ncbi:DUF1254 domain-containing protein [Cellulomonas sp. PhB150]|uniref:DUF1254 domain-containing protein n=1 Tax=Cellulomonas sp. PhB150 TaxID=2485188 RepID=UPI000FA25B85|nr:DUF1254 domain-containing protein [Cellulomonas sp. PhB150]ROS30577.1 hypothetical protein EDF34_0216 [Cellulomonas sp. PhB150]